jgi:hypothetical protein
MTEKENELTQTVAELIVILVFFAELVMVKNYF